MSKSRLKSKFKQSKSEAQWVSRETMQKYMKERRPDYQRKFRDHIKDKYVRMMSLGVFLTSRIVRVRLGGKWWNIDGQHHMAAALEGEYSAIRVLFEEYHVETEKEYFELFTCFDAENAPRTQKDCARAYYLGHKDELPKEADDTKIAMFKAGVEFAEGMGGGGPWKRRLKLKTERFHDAMEHMEEFKFFLSLLPFKTRRTIQRAPVCAVVVLSYQVDPKQALKFWSPVIKGLEYNEKDPQWKLRDYLTSVRLEGIANVEGLPGKQVSRKQIYIACVRCWNAFREGRKLTNIQTRKNKSGKIAIPELV